MSTNKIEQIALDELFAVIESRREADPEVSHTARLFERGVPYIAQKVGEETVETVIEAVRGDTDGIRAESADLLYHLLVLWAATGIRPAEVWAELAERRGLSGVEEKRQRNG